MSVLLLFFLLHRLGLSWRGLLAGWELVVYSSFRRIIVSNVHLRLGSRIVLDFF